MIEMAKHCTPCEGFTKPLSATQAEQLLSHVPGWKLAGEVALRAEWKFNNFKEAQAFVNQVGELAEAEGHHPDISFGWGYANILLTTHAINGLSENDFIIASKINNLT